MHASALGGDDPEQCFIRIPYNRKCRNTNLQTGRATNDCKNVRRPPKRCRVGYNVIEAPGGKKGVRQAALALSLLQSLASTLG